MGECLGERYLIVKIPHKAVDAAAVREAFGLSLRKLGRSKCDLLLLHWPSTELIRHWEVLMELKRLGKARAIGICNVGSDVIQQLTEPPAVVQTELAPVQADRRSHLNRARRTHL